jgi:hypothetical protein
MKITPRATIPLLLLALLTSGQVFAWGATGHQRVGAIAAELIVGTRAEREVRRILGDESLAISGTWADCVRSVRNEHPRRYVADTRYPHCRAFESRRGKREMEDYVLRNDAPCKRNGAEACHLGYHYTDVAVQRDAYVAGEAGTRTDDIVPALVATIRRLQGKSVDKPFRFANSKEALRVLVHLVGDLHQPLHVAGVYLDASGRVLDPDLGAGSAIEETQGGNLLQLAKTNMHSVWDGIPPQLADPASLATAVARARAVPVTPGPAQSWPWVWATDSVVASHVAFAGLTYGVKDAATGRWPANVPANYDATRVALQEVQLQKAGAHLAQLLQAIWR